MTDTTFAAPDLHEDFPNSFPPSEATLQVEKINITVLALDLGTKCGYALRKRDGRVIHGTEIFTPRKSWTPGQRGLRFRSWLVEILNTHQVHQIAYEAVQRHIGTDAAHLYGLFEGLVWMAADSACIPVKSVGVGVIKKSWTGWGDTAKEGMIAEARRRGYRPDSDNAADALAILDWALMRESDGVIRLGDGSMPAPATVIRRPRKVKATTGKSQFELLGSMAQEQL